MRSARKMVWVDAGRVIAAMHDDIIAKPSVMYLERNTVREQCLVVVGYDAVTPPVPRSSPFPALINTFWCSFRPKVALDAAKLLDVAGAIKYLAALFTWPVNEVSHDVDSTSLGLRCQHLGAI